MTKLERIYLIAIIESDFNWGSGYAGRDTIGNPVWAFDPAERFAADAGKPASSAGGVAASLQKKGLAFTSTFDHPDDENTIHITEAGYDALIASGFEPRS